MLKTIKLDNKYENYLSKYLRIFYFIGAFLIVLGNLADIFNNTSIQIRYTIITNSIAIFITILSFLLHYFKRIDLKLAFLVLVILIFVNSSASVIHKIGIDEYPRFFYRETVFMLAVITFGGFISYKFVPPLFSFIYVLLSIYISLVSADEFILRNLPFMSILLIIYSFIIYFFVDLLENLFNEIDAKSLIIKEHLEEITAQNEELQQSHEELQAQRDAIWNTNEKMLEKNLELEQTHQELLKVNKTRDKLFSIISHDIKNPFNAVMGFSKILHERFDEIDEEKKKYYLKLINTSTNNLYGLLEQLLSWAKAQHGDIKFEPVEIVMCDLINSAVSFFKPALKEKKIKVHISEPQYNLIVWGDFNMLDTVLRNILNNAIKFSNQDSQINITCKKEDTEFIQVSIRDYGKGMTKEIISKLFELDESKVKDGTDGERGTGLGLIVCKEFMEKNGGQIWVESEPDKGSTFYIQIPAAN